MGNAESYQSPVDQSCHARRNVTVGTNARHMIGYAITLEPSLCYTGRGKQIFVFWIHIHIHHRQKKAFERSTFMKEIGSLHAHTLLQRFVIIGYAPGECESGEEFSTRGHIRVPLYRHPSGIPYKSEHLEGGIEVQIAHCRWANLIPNSSHKSKQTQNTNNNNYY